MEEEQEAATAAVAAVALELIMEDEVPKASSSSVMLVNFDKEE